MRNLVFAVMALVAASFVVSCDPNNQQQADAEIADSVQVDSVASDTTANDTVLELE